MASENNTIDLTCCPRCRRPHKPLCFAPLSNTIYASTSETMTHWVACPELGEPILMGTRDLSMYGGDPNISAEVKQCF